MNKLLKFGCFIIWFHALIICNQESQEKMQYASFDSDVKISKNQYLSEGFLQGILIKTINGYIPIEQIQVGDVLVGMHDSQEILSVKKGKVTQHVRLLIGDDYIYAGKHGYQLVL